MKDILILLSNLFLSRITSIVPIPEPKCKNGILKFIALMCLGVAYVLGCRALYFQLLTEWGMVDSLLAMCAVLVGTSVLLGIIVWIRKPKTNPAKEVMGDWMEKINDIKNDIKPAEISKEIFAVMSSKPMVIFLTGAAIILCYLNFKKSDSKIVSEK